MKYSVFLWLLTWSGILTGLYNVLTPNFLSSTFTFINGIRALFPILATLLAFFTMAVSKSWEIPLRKGPLGCLFLYGIIGLAFTFLSPRPLIAGYWAAVYLSVPVVVWLFVNQGSALKQARRLIHINWIIVISILFITLIGPFRPLLSIDPYQYGSYRVDLPLGMGTQTANGMGRFAAIAGLVVLLRLWQRSGRRIFWIIAGAGSLAVLAYSQSRSALLGFILASSLLLWISGKRWWFTLGTPAIAYLVWLSGYKWRAGSSLEGLFLTGRVQFWKEALQLWGESPIVGYGFHADRLLMGGEHMHNAYLHSLLQTGIIGATFFVAAFFLAWRLVFRHWLFRPRRGIPETDRLLLIESIAVLTFLTVRSFFESSAAFYGVDLLILAPIFAYLFIWVQSEKKGASAKL